VSSTIVAENTCPMSDHFDGHPISCVMQSAYCCARACSAADKRAIASARSLAAMRGHGPSSNARRAAATARSMSSVVASGTLAMVSSVRGEITSSVSRPVDATHSPPMKSLS